MSTSWNWPGSRWWRVDLHAHTPASHDFKPQADQANPDWTQWVEAVRAAGLDAAAITDHNTAAGIAQLQGAAAGLEDAPVLFPGVELTASDGVHLLWLMDPGCTRQHIEDLLTRVEIPVEQRGRQIARSSLSVERILEACGDEALIVGAHVKLLTKETRPDDAVEVSFKDRSASNWKPLTQGSPGQQTAALLAFVLGYGSEPIILDQPEDDLDNTLIYELLVSSLRETKTKRQVIVVTHNPNIVVHGDAELVISLKAAKGQSSIDCQGGLQERDVRDVICSVMEGGREAFESRYKRIIPPGSSAP